MNADWLVFAGRFHPLTLHLPIGLLAAVFLLEIQKWFIRDPLRRGCHPCLKLLYIAAALSACVASATGYLLSREEGYAAAALNAHLKMALLFTAAIALTAVLALRPAGERRLGIGMLRFPMLWLSLLLMTAAGHRGGMMTHGATFLSEHAPSWLQPWVGPEESQETHPETTDKTVYAALVQPILASHCTSCHGADKRRAGLALHTPVRARRAHPAVAGLGGDQDRRWPRMTTGNHCCFIPSRFPLGTGCTCHPRECRNSQSDRWPC